MLKSNYKIIFVFFFVILFPITPLLSQIDSSYIQSFDQDFSARFYFNEKNASFNQTIKNKQIDYKTNTPRSIGVGGAWKHLSFSFSKGFDAFRNRNRGKTENIEFQHHSYGKKIIYDIILQKHKGFYRNEQNPDGTYDIYPNMTLKMYGGAMQYVFNNKKFSPSAAFSLSERQIKSAGSILLGGSIYYSKINTDSIVFFDEIKTKQRNLQFGVTLGYAFSWAITKRWTATPSITLGAMMGNNYPKHFFNKKMKVYPSVNTRFALSYNAHDWSIGTVFLFNRVFLFNEKNKSLSMANEQLQLTFVKRFNWNNKFVNSILNRISNTQNKLKL